MFEVLTKYITVLEVAKDSCELMMLQCTVVVLYNMLSIITY